MMTSGASRPREQDGQRGVPPFFSRRTKVLFVLLTPLLVVIVLYAMARTNVSRALEAKYAEIRAAGLPVTLEELDAWYAQPPPGQNAAEMVLEALAHYTWVSEEIAKELPLVRGGKPLACSEPLPVEVRNAASAYVSQNAITLQLLRRDMSGRRGRYPLDLTAGFNVELPHLAKIRECARLLCTQAILCAEDADPQGATDALEASLSVARTLDDEPILISQLVRIACVSIFVNTSNRVVNRAEFSDGQLSELSRALSEVDSSRQFWRGLAGERCMLVGFASGEGPCPDKIGKENSKGYRALLATYRDVGLQQREILYCLRAYDLLIDATRKPKPMTDPATAEIRAMFEDPPRFMFLASLLLGAIGRSGEAQIRDIAQCRTALASLAIERFRLANGRLPNALDELVPRYLESIPSDPVDGKPLRYRLLSPGYVVYSIGKDMEDDGGIESEKTRNAWESGDISFVVER